jgi:VIT1/CCC1 family predicted Fe2+/Mn2+ transporter
MDPHPKANSVTRPANAKELEALKHEHSREEIRRRLAEGPRHSYLKDFIYGAVDGAVTTFAVVGGVAGAGMPHVIIVVLGMANILADGFSMAVSNYLGTKAEGEQRDKTRAIELRHIELVPDGEREEIRQIYAGKGFEGEDLERIVARITSDKDLWVDTMIQEQYGLPKTSISPVRAGLFTFLAFMLFGLIPLIPYMFAWITGRSAEGHFATSAVMTGAAFFSVGAIKGRFVEKPWYATGLETLLVGGCAAALAYGVGFLFRGVVT